MRRVCTRAESIALQVSRCLGTAAEHLKRQTGDSRLQAEEVQTEAWTETSTETWTEVWIEHSTIARHQVEELEEAAEGREKVDESMRAMG